MQIGQRDGSRLRKQNTAMSASYATPLDESKRGPIPIYAANNSPTRGAPVAGFRARWRQTTARVRSRRYNLPSQPSASSSLALGRPA
jgi:hypothetical protein